MENSQQIEDKKSRKGSDDSLSAESDLSQKRESDQESSRVNDEKIHQQETEMEHKNDTKLHDSKLSEPQQSLLFDNSLNSKKDGPKNEKCDQHENIEELNQDDRDLREWEEEGLNEDESDDDFYYSDDEEERRVDQLEETGFVEEEELKKLSQKDEDIDTARIQSESLQLFEHKVEPKFLIVLYVVFKKQVYELFPRKGPLQIDLHPANYDRIKIYGKSKAEAKKKISELSNFIDCLSVLKLNIGQEESFRMRHSRKLQNQLRKNYLVIFSHGSSAHKNKSYYIGGYGTQQHLNERFKAIRSLKFRYFRGSEYRNTRSYQIIFKWIVDHPECLKGLGKWKVKDIEAVEYIPNFSNLSWTSPKNHKEHSVCFLVTSYGSDFSPKDMEYHFSSFVKNTFYAIVLLLKRKSKKIFYPKLEVEGVKFKYLREKKFSRSYVYIMGLKSEFEGKRELIKKQLSKLEENCVIYGARYFKNIQPSFNEYVMPPQYKSQIYPKSRPYSFIVFPRKVKAEGQQSQEKEEGTSVKDPVEQKGEEKAFGEFDWMAHIDNIQNTEISVLETSKVEQKQ